MALNRRCREADLPGINPSTSEVRTILEAATGLPGKVDKGGGVIAPRGGPLMPGAVVKFPEDQVLTLDRATVWVAAGRIHLGMWPAEVQTQYKPFYSDPKKVEAVISLADSDGCKVNSNFHIAYWHAQPAHRWYPHLGEAAQIRRWIDDIPRGRANARSRQDIEDTDFRRWLVERGLAHDDELPTLDNWLDDHPTVKQFFIRPGVQILRTWPLTDRAAENRSRELVSEVRDAIDRVLSALHEPQLSTLRLRTHTTGQSARRVRDVKPQRDAAAAQTNVCPTCQMVHTGECP
ncbi:hypothetical protein [Mycobacterium intracellulare]|uniref:hypothetical protein n=1 Tax=Mycobacterium intracellulare TaxID=1767 RepID=UPI00109EB663|nr:hypothetical protein [Mycobacterium intracellulare]